MKYLTTEKKDDYKKSRLSLKKTSFKYFQYY